MEFRPGIPCLVAANKIDIDLEVIKKTFNFATKRGLQLFYVSASEGGTCCVHVGLVLRESCACKLACGG